MSARADVGRFEEVALDAIDEPQLATRTAMDDTQLDALTESIRANGILQNLVLVARGARYEVVAGHRRTIAARRAGLLTVPAKVYPPDHPALRVMQCHENGRREDVNPVDEAFWFGELLEQECGGDVERLSGLVGETLGYVLGRLELLELDDTTRDALRAGRIRIGVAKQLRRCGDLPTRLYYLDCAVRGGANEALVLQWVNDWKARQAVTPPQPAPAAAPLESVPTSSYDPMRCYVCGEVSATEIPEAVSIHKSCRLAIVDKLLRGAR